MRALALAIVLTLALVGTIAAGAQPVPVFEASGYGVVRPWEAMNRTLRLAVRPASAPGGAEIATVPRLYSNSKRVDRWAVTAEGVPYFRGSVATALPATAAAWADMDGDGLLDLAVAGLEQDSPWRSGIEVFRSTPSGDLEAGRLILPTNFGIAAVDLAPLDADADGRTDLACSRTTDAARTIILLNRGPDSLLVASGSFGREVPGDRFVQLSIDGDAFPDLVTYSEWSQCLYLLHGRGDGGYEWTDAPPGSVPADAAPRLADLDGDGVLDLRAGRYTYRWTPGTVPVLFDSSGTVARGIADFDRDGHPDLVSGADGRVGIAFGRGGFDFDPAAELAFGGVNASLTSWVHGGPGDLFAVEDVTGDGRQDLVAASMNGRVLEVARARSDGSFFQPLLLPSGARPAQVALADVAGGDGRLDLVTLARGARRLEVRPGGGDGTFGPPRPVALPAGARRFALGDLDEDGQPDVAVACDTARVLSVLRGDGNSFTDRVDYPAGDSLVDVAIAELDSDSHLDVMATPGTGSCDSPRRWSGSGSLDLVAQPMTVNSGTDGRIRLIDWNQDGHVDWALTRPACCAGGEARVVAGDGHGNFPQGIDLAWMPSGGHDSPIDVAGPDASGEQVFFVAARDSEGTNYAWLTGLAADESGVFTHYICTGSPWNWSSGAPSYELAPTPIQLEIADVTADGLRDVVVLSREPAVLTVLPALPGGLFGEPVLHVVGRDPVSFALGDVDGDGLPDAVVANQGADNVVVLRHRGAQVNAVPAPVAGGALALRVRSALGATHPRLELTLPSVAPAVVELFDAQGRRLASRRLEAPAIGANIVEFGAEPLPAAGLLFARARQGAATASVRFVRLR